MSGIKKEIKLGLQAPIGHEKRVMTPWLTEETAMVVTNRGLGTKKESYAMIERPASNPHVAFSVFKVNG